jgi:oligopeptide/dipeptide ABC transporter ATP-binding protein
MNNPQHPYTQALLSAIPHPLAERKTRVVLHGELPDPTDPPSGCVFHTRCHKRRAELDVQCVSSIPDRRKISAEHTVACHLPFQQESQAVDQTGISK